MHDSSEGSLPTEEEPERRAKYLVGVWLRVVAAGTLLLFLALFSASGWAFPVAESWPAYAALSALVLANYPYWVVGRARRYPLKDFYAHWLVDLVLISCVVIGLGRPVLSAAITGYLLIVVSSALFISGRASYIVASGASIACVVVALGELGQSDIRTGYAAEDVWASRVFVLGGSVILMFLIAHIAGTLADRVSDTNAVLRLRNVELDVKNRQLEALQKEVEFQTSILTHDLRSPIAAAASAAALIRGLLREPSNSNVMGLLDLIDENVNRVDAMIDALQRLQQMGLEGEAYDLLEDIRLSEIWQGLLPEITREIEDKHIEVELRDGKLVGMRDRLVVAVRNLVQNAIRHCPSVGGKVWLEVAEAAAEWRVIVGDNGEGVPAEYRKRIFEMFGRVPGVERSKGLGIGLALVRRIAELHGGRVWVTDGADGGAEFCIVIPKHGNKGWT